MDNEITTTEPDPFEDGNFFPEKKPAGYPSFHNYKRDREAARLSAMGHSAIEIAEQLHLYDRETGEPDPRRAVKAVKRGLSMVHQFTVDEKRTEQLHALEMMKRHLWESLNHEHVLVQQGRVILVDGIPVEDRRFVLETFDRLLKIEAQQMDLLGTKAAQRFSVEADQIGGEITSLIAMINQAPAPAGEVEQGPARPELEPGDE
jgi:hypothetical protein